MLKTALVALVALPACMGFAGLPQLPLRNSASHSGLRRAPVTSVRMEVDPVVIQGAVAGLGGIGAAVGILYLIESQGVKSAERMDETLLTKLNAKVDGGEAENVFSGSDQSLDALIANMEAAQGIKKEPKKEEVKAAAAKADDDDGW